MKTHFSTALNDPSAVGSSGVEKCAQACNRIIISVKYKLLLEFNTQYELYQIQRTNAKNCGREKCRKCFTLGS